MDKDRLTREKAKTFYLLLTFLHGTGVLFKNYSLRHCTHRALLVELSTSNWKQDLYE